MDHIADSIQIELLMDDIATFCMRRNIVEFALFGSVLHADFGPDSDVDVLITFASDAEQAPNREALRTEIEAIIGRPVDLTYRRVIENDPNYIIRKSILNSARVIYAA